MHENSITPSAWLEHFTNLAEPKTEFKTRIQELEKKLSSLEKQKLFTELDCTISNEEITKAISKIKSNKAPGLDSISNNMIKHGQLYLLASFKKLFNKCFTFGIYPEAWASGYIVPLYKNNDPSDPNNYRGITIANAFGKLFNKILDTRLDGFLEKHKIISDCQIGFTRKARSSDHMFILKSVIDKYCRTKDGRLFACFVDFKKAFDTVIHTGIKIKLLDIGVGSLFYNIVKNMYNLSQSCVRIKRNITNFFPVNLGVKQGDNLSPNLFKIFINDLPEYLLDTPDPIIINTRRLDCLMYADDLILLSTSAKGLQKKLDKLHSYCQDWCLSLNTNKTKTLIFNKAGRHIKHVFTYNNVRIESVSHYKYLGLYFSASGSFSFARKELYNKAQKAYFKLCKDFLSINPGIKTSIHVFDHTIKPILLYGSEIWAFLNPFTSKFKNGTFSLDDIYGKFPCEKLHSKFCKFILGLHKRTTNFAALSELGRFPLHFDIIRSIINYWYRLENLGSSFPLLKEAYLNSKNLHEAKASSWYGYTQTLINHIQGLTDLSGKSKYTFKQLSKKLIKSHYLKEWQQKREKYASGKLDQYCLFKENFGIENYLLVVKRYEQRRTLTRFRVSAHKLRVEQARYQGILRQDRICLRCTSNDIEDESHFLFKCSKFTIERNKLFQQIENICKNFASLDDRNKFIWLMTTENIEILSYLSDYIKYHEI